MPNTSEAQAQREAAMAEALSAGRHDAAHLANVEGVARTTGAYSQGVSRQPTDPRIGQAGRVANLLRVAEAAGILADDFAPVIPRNLTTGEPIEVLTPKQVPVLRCAAQGLSYTETAEALHLNISTVKGHVRGYYRTLLGTDSPGTAPEAIVAAIRCGVLPRSILTGEADTAAPAPASGPQRSARVRCSGEGCRSRTAHASGRCPAHRED